MLFIITDSYIMVMNIFKALSNAIIMTTCNKIYCLINLVIMNVVQ